MMRLNRSSSFWRGNILRPYTSGTISISLFFPCFQCAEPIRPFNQHCLQPPLHRLKTFSALCAEWSWTPRMRSMEWCGNMIKSSARLCSKRRSPVLIRPTCGLSVRWMPATHTRTQVMCMHIHAYIVFHPLICTTKATSVSASNSKNARWFYHCHRECLTEFSKQWKIALYVYCFTCLLFRTWRCSGAFK